MRLIKTGLFLSFVLVASLAKGQSISSVYSDRGIGLLDYQGLPNNLAMGEVGIGTPSIFNLNFQNPAFLPLNSLTVLQVGIEMDRRNLSNSDQSTKLVSGGLKYFNLGFPIVSGKWTTSVGLNPYSTTNYKSFSVGSLDDGRIPTVTEFTGSGGLTSFNWSNGFKVTDELFLGVRTEYLFGSISDKVSTFITDTLSSSYSVDFIDETTYSGSKLELSLGYRKLLSEEKALNFGLVYKLSKDINGINNKRFERNLGTGFSDSDPLYLVKDQKNSFSLPRSIGLGISYQVFNRFTLGMDVTSTNWSVAGEDGDEFNNTANIGIGGQWTPDYSSVSNYWKRATYRVGVSMGKLPFMVEENEISEFGINFGSSLPVGYSSLDLAMKYGIMGTTDNNLIRERYFRIVLGATINDRWFQKRRYD